MAMLSINIIAAIKSRRVHPGFFTKKLGCKSSFKLDLIFSKIGASRLFDMLDVMQINHVHIGVVPGF